MARLILAGLLGLAAIACSTQPAANAGEAASNGGQIASEAGRHPISGLEIIDVTVTSGNRSHVFKSELALTGEAQARGLMYRTELADDEGMLFPSQIPTPRSFWMKNTPLPLDIIFIGVDGRISNIEAGVPYSLDSVLSVGSTSAVLELRGGLSEELGIAPGDKVEWALVAPATATE